MKEQLEKLILSAVIELGADITKVSLEHPEDITHGDYSTNAALVLSKQLKQSPREVAEKLLEILKSHQPAEVEKMEIAGPGFINFYLSAKFFETTTKAILKVGKKYGSNKDLAGQNILIEYTDPNPFKQFHIGHLMSNSIGEAVSRLIVFSGANVKRACYQGDVGLHVAKAIWGYQKLQTYLKDRKDKVVIYDNETVILSPENGVAFWGLAYAFGSSEYDKEGESKLEIDKLNRVIFNGGNDEIKKIYDAGKKVSLVHFEEIYKKLDTKFDRYYFESEVVGRGLDLVNKYTAKEGIKGIFEKSENAIVFHGEDYGLHTRVFINSFGVPLYETKELGLNNIKFEEYPNLSQSIIVTANEQSEYFKVVLKALGLISPEVVNKTKHVSHGMLRFASGKMSSRKGNIITGESLITDTENLAKDKLKDRQLPEEEKAKIAEEVAIGAIRYSILKQEAGKDIIYDLEKSLSFEGDSGPYLQYACVRARAVLDKAKKAGIGGFWSSLFKPLNRGDIQILELERLLYRFPEVVVRSREDYTAHHVVTYLINIASTISNCNHSIPRET
jgi:arginyl-tRNA synthetase